MEKLNLAEMTAEEVEQLAMKLSDLCIAAVKKAEGECTKILIGTGMKAEVFLQMKAK